MSYVKIIKQSLSNLFLLRRFIIVGLLNTFIGYCIFLLAMYLFDEIRWISLGLVFIFGLCINYFTHAHLVFRSKGFHHLQGFVLIYAVIYILNLQALNLLVGHFSLTYVLAQAVLTPPVALLTFMSLSLLFFRRGIWRAEKK